MKITPGAPVIASEAKQSATYLGEGNKLTGRLLRRFAPRNDQGNGHL
jgi:hypothetical protein